MIQECIISKYVFLGNLYANTDQSSIDKTSTCLDGEKAPNPLSSPNSRKSTSPTRHGPEKRLSIDSKGNMVVVLCRDIFFMVQKSFQDNRICFKMT